MNMTGNTATWRLLISREYLQMQAHKKGWNTMTEGIPTVLQEQVDSLANTQTDNGAPASAPAEPVTPPTTPPADDDASPVEPQVLE